MAQPTSDFQQEVRFAVVMYGGVSLAIYINGIAQEMLRMVRATAPDPARPGQLLVAEPKGTEAVYRKIGQLLGQPAGSDWKKVLDDLNDPNRQTPLPPVHSRFVVDILSGTSAGGINGIYLAKALANGQSLEELKKLWVSEGNIEVLLNDKASIAGVPGLAAQKPPQALLNGERMYRKLLAAFEGMEAGSPAGPLVDQVDLFVTTTDIRGLPLPIKLADGVVWEKRHKNVFPFRYDQAEGVNDFAPENNPVLALAARCTSSFPFAFEPFELGDLKDLLPGGLPDETAAGWKADYFPAYRVPEGVQHPANAYDAAARAFGDGGYLDNKPFSYAIDALAKRSSELPVRRKLIYVEPSPEHPEDQRVKPEKPDVLENVSAALSLARYETIREDLQRILARNRLIERVEFYLAGVENHFDWKQESLKPTDRFSVGDLEERIARFGPSYRSYHELKVSAVTDAVATWIARAYEFDLQSDQFLAIRYLSRAWREVNFTSISAPAGTTAAPADAPRPWTESDFLRFYDLGYRMRRLRFVMNRIDRLSPLDPSAKKVLANWHHEPPQGEEASAFRGALTTLRKALSEVLRRFRQLEGKLEGLGASNPIRQDLEQPLRVKSSYLMGLLEGAGDGERAMERARAGSQEHSAEFKRFAMELQERLRKDTEPAADACKQALQTPPGAAPAAVLAYDLVRHYFEEYEVFDLISFPILYSTEVGDEISPVEVYRFSPEDATSILDERETGRRKLAGTTLGHFGAFLDRGFRRNDILWGRLDGAERLITTLLPGDEYAATRQALCQEANLAILAEELQTLDQTQLGEIVAKAWLATDSQEPNETALRALAERELGAKANPGFQAALRQALTSVDREHLLRFYKEEFNCPRDINSRLAITSLARSTQIVGAILADLGNRYQKDSRPGAWIARLGGWFWGFVEVAVPRSVPNLVFRHWLQLLYLFEALLIVGGILFSKPGVLQLGWSALGVTALLNLLLFVLTDLLSGRGRWLKGVVILVGILLLLLAALGAAQLPGLLAAWKASDGMS
ncbi:MAG TPA: patatin-like protein [Thermoanaerobaculia bacterium]|nr:patatin-like protein [Thermoanaerobaculia bacterium]